MLLPIVVTLAALSPPAAPAALFRSERSNHHAYVAPRTDSKLGRATLAILDPMQLRGRVQEEATADLVALGADAVPTLFGFLAGTLEGPRPALRDATPSQIAAIDPDAIALEQDAIVSAALLHLPSARVVDDVTAAATGGASLQTRLVAMRVLGACDSPSAVDAWMEIASEIDEVELGRAFVRGPCESALGDVLARGPNAFAHLAPHVKALPRKLAPLVVRAVSGAGRAQGVDVLVSMLGRDRDLDLAILPEIASLAENALGGLTEQQLTWIRPFLGDEDWRIRREAAVALGRVHDARSYREIVGCLSDGHRLVQQAGLWSLRHMSGRDFDDDGERWRAWFEEETRWYETRGVARIESLRDPDPAVVMEAARDLVQRPLYKHEIAESLSTVLHSSNALLVTGVAEALAELGSPRAVRPLCAALSHSDPAVRRAAHAALRKLTGHSWPMASAEWARLSQ
jgi:HEAT repeat protein